MRLPAPFLAALLTAAPLSVPAQEPPRPAAPACVAVPLSGPHAGLGTRVIAAVEAALRDAPIELALRRYDTRGTAPDAEAAIRKAAEDGCPAVLGGLGDREAEAMADAAEAAGLPLLSLGSAPDGRVRKDGVQVRLSRDERLAVLARALASDGVRDVVAVVPESAYGRRAIAGLRAALGTAKGPRLALVRTYASGDDLGKVAAGVADDLARVPDREACQRDAVFVPADLPTARRLLPFLAFAGVAGPRSDPRCPAPVVAGTELWNDPALLARSGDALDGAVFVDVPGGASLADDAADGAALLVAALRTAAAGGGREAVARLLRGEVAFTGRGGDLVLSGGRVTGRVPVLLQVRRGVIEPRDAAGPAAAK